MFKRVLFESVIDKQEVLRFSTDKIFSKCEHISQSVLSAAMVLNYAKKFTSESKVFALIRG